MPRSAEYNQMAMSASFTPVGSGASQQAQWYAVHTMAKHEKRVAEKLEEKRILTFLPVLQQIHRWSDRLRKVDVPLFNCYAFVHIAPTPENRVEVLTTKGALSFVGNQGRGTPIRDEEIENLRTTVRAKIPCLEHPYVETGQRVRICGGSLDGVEGIFERRGEDQSLVLSVDLLRRSVSIRVEGYEIQSI